ncbi:mevalonate kinase family protein [Haploplasma axanthum]|nr:hypothetical protein [Haploplasma axanthum]
MNIKTSGKLYIAGEYEVLSKKGNAIIYGISKYIDFEIVESNEFFYQTRNQKYVYQYENNEIIDTTNEHLLIMEALKSSFNYLETKKIIIEPFGINIKTELEDEKRQKYGFGSSAALISGIIKVILTKYLKSVDNELVFKLSVLTQISTNTLSSGGDLAAAIYGNMVYYERYNLKWLLKKYNKKDIADIDWADLKIFQFNTNQKFAAIWTKKSYQTKQLTRIIRKKEYRTARKIVNNVYVNLVNNKYLELKENLKDYQKWLENILANDDLVTSEIKKALEITNKFHLSAKISGAGGGDSVIVLYPNGYDFKALREELIKNDLELFVF